MIEPAHCPGTNTLLVFIPLSVSIDSEPLPLLLQTLHIHTDKDADHLKQSGLYILRYPTPWQTRTHSSSSVSTIIPVTIQTHALTRSNSSISFFPCNHSFSTRMSSMISPLAEATSYLRQTTVIGIRYRRAFTARRRNSGWVVECHSGWCGDPSSFFSR